MSSEMSISLSGPPLNTPEKSMFELMTVDPVIPKEVPLHVKLLSPSMVPSPVQTPIWLFTGVPTLVTSPPPPPPGWRAPAAGSRGAPSSRPRRARGAPAARGTGSARRQSAGASRLVQPTSRASQATRTGMFSVRIFSAHCAGAVLCTDVPAASTATVTGMSLTSNS